MLSLRKEREMQMNVALVGCGRVSKKHVAAIEAHRGLEFFACFDIIKERMHKNTGHYLSFEDMINDEHVDIISICTPSDLHASMAMRAMQAGKHVLLEKPIAISLTYARHVMEASEKFDRKIAVVAQNRFNEPMADLKSKVTSCDFGEIKLASAVCRWYRPPEYFEDWHGEMSRSGGVLINQALHHIDALLWLAGDIKRVRCRVDDVKFPKSAVAVMTFENGAIGTLEATVEAYPRNVESSVNLVMEKGTFKVGGHALNKWDTQHADEIELREQTEDVYGYGHIKQYEELYDAIVEDREPSTSVFDGFQAVRVADTMYWTARHWS